MTPGLSAQHNALKIRVALAFKTFLASNDDYWFTQPGLPIVDSDFSISF
jgi:hypothetical protein